MNIAPFPIAGGHLPSGVAASDKSQSCTNCVAVREATVGQWIININGITYDRTKHLIVANITAIATSDPLQVETGSGGVGGILISALRNVGAGLAAADLEMTFVILQRPEVT